jgi:predicted ester cyclase
MAPDAISHGLYDTAGEEAAGPGAFRPFFQRMRMAIPDIHFTVEDALVDGGNIAVRCRVTGTHTGPGLTAAPANQTINVTGMVFARVKDGRIVEGWSNFDFLSLYRQLGLQLSEVASPGR